MQESIVSRCDGIKVLGNKGEVIWMTVGKGADGDGRASREDMLGSNRIP